MPFLSDEVRALLQAPLATPQAREGLGDALWLYVHLVSIANSSGHVCRTIASLASDLRITVAEIDRWFGRLAAAKLVVIQTPAPYLVLKLTAWPGDTSAPRQDPAKNAGQSALVLSNVPVSSSKLLPEQQPEAAPAAGVDGGLGEGEGLASVARHVLGAVDAVGLAELVGRYPSSVVQRALARVERTPPAKVRKSRFALFRYLLVKLSQQSHDHHPPRQA